MIQRLYRYIFWAGYIAVLITTFLPVKGELNKINIGPDAFHIRLDHLLHLLVYFLICMYYLAGQKNGLSLFSANSIIKFLILVLFLAVSTELVQIWVPERVFNAWDLVSNVVGVLLGVGVIRMAQRHRGTTTLRH